MVEFAKQNLGKLSFASSTAGSPGHLAGEFLKQLTGIQIEHVPYKGGAQAIADFDRINAAVNRAVSASAFSTRMAEIGNEAAGGTPEEFAELIRRDSARWGELIRKAGIRAD